MQVIPGYINIQMINGVTPVYLGIFQINMIIHGILNHLKIVKFKAAQENNQPLVKYLIKLGANINLRANDGMNVIHVCCQNGNLDMVELLVRNV
jgi:hypothetical protein